jgi:hypothetical protein
MRLYFLLFSILWIASAASALEVGPAIDILRFEPKVAAQASKWTAISLDALKLSDLRVASKIENISALAEKAVEAGRISLVDSLRIKKEFGAIERGDEVLLKFLHSQSKDYRTFLKPRVTGGSSLQLGINIGKPETDEWAAHHLIPSELADHPVLEKVEFYLDDARNGFALPRRPGVDPVLPIHSGSHPVYTEGVKARLDAVPVTLSPEETEKRISLIQNELRYKLSIGTPIHIKYGAPVAW